MACCLELSTVVWVLWLGFFSVAQGFGVVHCFGWFGVYGFVLFGPVEALGSGIIQGLGLLKVCRFGLWGSFGLTGLAVFWF